MPISFTHPVLIGLDLGTTNLKAVAARPDGTVLALARRSMRVRTPAFDAAEFDLGSLDRDVPAMLADLVDRLGEQGIPASAVAGVGVASIGEAFVGLDASLACATPCPTWYDRRTAPGRTALGLSSERWFDITGMVDDDIYTVHRLRWWRDVAQAEWWPHVVHWLMVSDYVVWRLTGRLAASPSLAARSGLADRTTLDWSDEILDPASIDRQSLPDLLPSATVAGGLSSDMAALTGLLAGTPVINAGHDHPCAGLGCGLVEPGQVIDSTGTSEALKTVVARPLGFREVEGGLYDCYPHVVPGRWLLSGHIPTGGGMLDWLVRQLSGPVPSPDVAAALWALATAAPPGAGGVRAEPFLNGTGQPLNQRNRRGALVGLSSATGSGEILRAGVESLASWVAANLAVFARITGTPITDVILTGGGARNGLSNRIKAALLSRPLTLTEVEETAGLGAALVAGLATGLFLDASEAGRRSGVAAQTLTPEPDLTGAYAELHEALITPWREHILG